MQLKMQEILGFSSFYNMVKNQKIPMKTAYRLAQLARSIEGETTFYNAKLREIIMQYALLDEEGMPISTEDGKGIKLRQGVEEECYSAIQELQDIEVTVPDIQLSIEDFDNVELTVVDMGVILPFITE